MIMDNPSAKSNTVIKQEFEYELIGIEWDLKYDLNDAQAPRMVKDGTNEENQQPSAIEYDKDGIPMGYSPEENRIRKQKIFAFYDAWKITHPQKSVHNKNLDADILIRNESVTEAAGHAARSYRSTLAVMRLDEILANAEYIDTDKIKPGNKNQSKLIRMILMSYNLPGLGKIKLTVGVRNRTFDKVQYGIMALAPNQEIKPIVATPDKKKASHKK